MVRNYKPQANPKARPNTNKSAYSREAVVSTNRRYTRLPWVPLEYADEYLLELELAMRSKSYITHMRTALSYFFLWCRDEKILNPNEIERRDILHFQAWVQQQEWKRSTQIQVLSFLRVYFGWMERNKYIAENPWYNIRIGQVQKQPNPLLPEEIELLFRTHTRRAFRLDPFLYHREEVVLVLLYSWGLRIHELEALNEQQFDPRNEFVTTVNKSRPKKSLPYNSELKGIVQRYITQRSRYANPLENALIIDREGRRLGINGIRGTVQSLGQEAGVHLTPHMLRDTCGTDLLTADVPLERVAKILGHSNTQQTLAYARVRDHRVAEDHERVMGPRIRSLLEQDLKRTQAPASTKTKRGKKGRS